jgi:hypothetical protein
MLVQIHGDNAVAPATYLDLFSRWDDFIQMACHAGA